MCCLTYFFYTLGYIEIKMTIVPTRELGRCVCIICRFTVRNYNTESLHLHVIYTKLQYSFPECIAEVKLSKNGAKIWIIFCR